MKECRHNVEKNGRIRRLAKEILGVSRRSSGQIKGTKQWNEEVTEKVKEKQDAYTLEPVRLSFCRERLVVESSCEQFCKKL